MGHAHAGRRDRLRGALVDAGIDALLVTALVNVRYLTGFTGTAGSVLVTADPDDDRFATDGRYADQASREVEDVAHVITRTPDWLADAVPPGARLGVEGDAMPWSDALALRSLLPDRTVGPTRAAVEALRACKDDEEIAAIRAACRIGDEALSTTLEIIRPGTTEREVAIALERTMVDLGAAERAFPSIVASGPNGAVPHHRPTERVLEIGDLVTLDFGAVVDGYRSDMTRMVAIGHPGDALMETVALVRAAQQAGVATVRHDIDGSAVDAACRDMIADAGLGERFVHGTGHGVGLDVHEAPRLAADAADTLRSRMVVTVEPGVYLPNRGGVRIEDTMVVADDHAEVLTTTPTDLIIL